MIYISLVESNTETAAQLIERWALAADQLYAVRRKNIEASHNSLLARAVIQRVLYEAGHNQAPIIVDARGKPHVQHGPHISISHSRNMVACALCEDFPIGIDIEHWQRRNFAKIADYAFGPNEIAAVEEDGAAAFYRIWTIREAIAKISGESVLSQMNGEDANLAKYQTIYLSPCPEYSLAVAAENRGIGLKNMIKWIDATV